MNHKMNELNKVWLQQLNYNAKIMDKIERNSADWMVDYILGTISELSELLNQMNWKKHRLTSVEQFGPNVEEELADITKYIFSMWQLLEYTPEGMLAAMYEKGEILEQIYRQENSPGYLNERILMLDLDGVVADFRTGFQDWIKTSRWAEILHMGEHEFGMHMDINHNWDYKSYDAAKVEFERAGGYKDLPAMPQAIYAVNTLSSLGWKIISFTARPQMTYKRIWSDTWIWLVQQGIHVDELHFASEDRVTMAYLLKDDNVVVALEDNPTLIQRYLGSGISVVMIPQVYNQDMYISPPKGLYTIGENAEAHKILDAINTCIEHIYTQKGNTNVRSCA